MSKELLQARQIAQQDIAMLNHPDIGFLAGFPRFAMVFTRDLRKFVEAMLRYEANFRIPGVLDGVEKATDLLYDNMGTKVNPATEEKPGKLPHQLANGFTPPEEFNKLVAGGFTEEIINGQRVIRYYGATDSTPGGLIIISHLADARAALAPEGSGLKVKERVIGKYYGKAVANFMHERDYADADKDGLTENTPGNLRLLLHHAERDSSATYDREDGTRPEPPFIYLGPNIVRYVGLRRFEKIAAMGGDGNLEREARDMADVTREQLLTRFRTPDGYFTPLIYGANQEQAQIINDEPLDLMYYRVLDPIKDQEMVDSIVDRSSQPDVLSPWGHYSLSNNSKRFRRNGPKAYWNGAIWFHRVGQNAQAYENYGEYALAASLDALIPRIQNRFGGSVENFTLNSRGDPVRYVERDKYGRIIGTACIPQLFAASSTMERTRDLEQQTA